MQLTLSLKHGKLSIYIWTPVEGIAIDVITLEPAMFDPVLISKVIINKHINMSLENTNGLKF